MKLSPLEIELGFQEIETIGLFDPYGDIPHQWVAKVLTEADVVARLGEVDSPSYQHWRFGKYDNCPTSNAQWHPISSLFSSDAKSLRQVITDSEFGADEVGKLHTVLPARADIKFLTKP